MSEDPAKFQMRSYDPEESIMCILFTSGTTGVPKGVMWSSRSTKIMVYSLRTREDPVYFASSPLYWMSYPAFVLCTLVHGNTILVPRTKYIPGTKSVDPTHALDCIQKYKANSWFTGPSILLELCTIPSSSSYDLSSLKSVLVGGSAFLPSQRRQICDTMFEGRPILLNSYGATEVGPITYWPEEERPDHDSPRSTSIGKLLPGFTLKVVDVETGAELGPGQTGEFVLKSSAIMKGYLNHDMPKRYTPEDWYKMGDLGYYDEDGFIFYSSRLKEIMKYRGLQISPAELEKVVMGHPQVHEVCVVGRPHPIDGERPAAFVVPKSTSLTADELQKFVNERVADSKKLRGGIFLQDSLPKSGVGKVLRRELLNRFENDLKS